MFNQRSNNMNPSFSHRPKAGISVGITTIGDKVYIAACFTHSNKDRFNRSIARSILTQRLTSVIRDNKDVEFIAVGHIPEGITERKIINRLRESFKPDPLEQDATFMNIDEFHGVETRTPIQRRQAWDLIKQLFYKTITS
jgi:hypothetical protein